MDIGIDIGGTHMAIGVINEKEEIIKKYEKDFTFEDKSNIISTIEKYIEETIKAIKEEFINDVSGNRERIGKIGIAVPGSTKDGIIYKAVNLGIENYNIAQSIMKKTGLPVQVINDSKSACIAEYDNLLKDKRNKVKNMLFLAIGTGIGGGVIYNGKLLTGTNYDGYELGHIVIKENGIQCNCGKKGCFEKYGNILQYKNKVKERLNIPQEVNAQPLRDIMNPRANEIEDLRQQYISDLAIGISNLVNIFEPDAIILGGGFTHFAYMFMDDLKDKLINSTLLFNRRDDIDLRCAELKNDAAMIGSIL